MLVNKFIPLLKEDSRIMIQDRLESESYAEMTARCLSRFGVCGEKTETGYYVKGAQKYHAPQTYSVEGDWSSAAFFIGADSLSYLSFSDLLKTVEGAACNFCAGCFNGVYPEDVSELLNCGKKNLLD